MAVGAVRVSRMIGVVVAFVLLACPAPAWDISPISVEFPDELLPENQDVDYHKILLHRVTIDTHKDPSATFHPGVTTRAASFLGWSERRTYMVHLRDPTEIQSRRAVEAVLGGRGVGEYIPYNTFLVQADECEMKAIAELPEVLWVGPFLPEYKYHDSTLLAGTTTSTSKGVHIGQDIHSGIRGDFPRVTEQELPVVLYALLMPPGRFEAKRTRDETVRIASGIQSTLRADKHLSRLSETQSLTVQGVSPEKVKITCAKNQVDQVVRNLASREDVLWIEPMRWNFVMNNFATGLIQSGTVGERTLWNKGIKGDDQIVAITDSGLDVDHCFFYDTETVPHVSNGGTLPASSHRKILGYWDSANNLGIVGDNEDSYNGHGTHVSGSVAGKLFNQGGSTTSSYEGMAPEAKIIFLDASDTNVEWESAIFVTDDLKDMFPFGYDNGARIHTNSWGSTGDGTYTLSAREIDEYLNDHPDFVVLFAAGNDGGPSSNPTIGVQALAKNCITVGARQSPKESFLIAPRMTSNACLRMASSSEKCVDAFADVVNSYASWFSEDNMACFSSAGFASDGRIKPDIVTPGRFIMSARSGSGSTCSQATEARVIRWIGDEPIRSTGMVVTGYCGARNQDDYPAGLPDELKPRGLAFADSVVYERVAQSEDVYVSNSWSVDFWIVKGCLESEDSSSIPDSSSPLVLSYYDFSSETWVELWSTTGKTISTFTFTHFVVDGPTDITYTRIRFRQTPTNTAQLRNVWVLDDVHLIASGDESGSDTNLLLGMEGTSMATPLAAGAAALVRQYLVEGWHVAGVKDVAKGISSPSGALIKALMIHGANKLGGKFEPGCEGCPDCTGPRISLSSDPNNPDRYQGYGAVELTNSLAFSDSSFVLWLPDTASGTLNMYPRNVYSVGIVPTSTHELRATIVWYDDPASPGAATTLITNIDLYIERGDDGTKYWPNGRSAADAVNTVERVVIETPVVGVPYNVTVVGSYVVGCPKPVALVITGMFDKGDISVSADLAVGDCDEHPDGAMTVSPMVAMTVLLSLLACAVMAWMGDISFGV